MRTVVRPESQDLVRCEAEIELLAAQQLVHQLYHLDNELVLPQVVPVLEDDLRCARPRPGGARCIETSERASWYWRRCDAVQMRRKKTALQQRDRIPADETEA
jgi:hypothetical protein